MHIITTAGRGISYNCGQHEKEPDQAISFLCLDNYNFVAIKNTFCGHKIFGLCLYPKKKTAFLQTIVNSLLFKGTLEVYCTFSYVANFKALFIPGPGVKITLFPKILLLFSSRSVC